MTTKLVPAILYTGWLVSMRRRSWNLPGPLVSHAHSLRPGPNASALIRLSFRATWPRRGG